MGNPLLGNNDTRDYNPNRCVCCWLVVVPAKNPLPVCVECAAKLTPGERAAIVFGVRQVELLRDMRGHLHILANNDAEDEVQLARIARTFEEFSRTLREVLKKMGGEEVKKDAAGNKIAGKAG